MAPVAGSSSDGFRYYLQSASIAGFDSRLGAAGFGGRLTSEEHRERWIQCATASLGGGGGGVRGEGEGGVVRGEGRGRGSERGGGGMVRG